MNKPYIVIKEFERIERGDQLTEAQFDALENFILANKKDKGDVADAYEFFDITVRNGKRCIVAKNYVGLITLKDGTSIEILPKITKAESEKDARKIMLAMLRTVKNLPFKTFNESNFATEKISLFEVFIGMFLDEVGKLIAMGLKSGYVMVEENERFLKGKLDFNLNIKLNAAHKERFCIIYDKFIANRPENKLIKSTLKYVYRKTQSEKNRRVCWMYLCVFANIDESVDYDSDFSKCVSNRTMSEYETLLAWCRVFLKNKSFMMYTGNHVAFALLFPMEQLFESYMAAKIAKYIRENYPDYTVKAQDRGCYLFDEPKRFALRPDIVISGKSSIVLDTKWKRLSSQKRDLGISPADMYQMYAYHKKYNPEKVILIYPFNEDVADVKEENDKTLYSAKDNVKVKIFFVDLKNIGDKDHGIEKLVKICELTA